MIAVVVILISPIVYNTYFQPAIKVKDNVTSFTWSSNFENNYYAILLNNITSISYISEKGYKNSTLQITISSNEQYGGDSCYFTINSLISGELASNIYPSNLVFSQNASGFPNQGSDNGNLELSYTEYEGKNISYNYENTIAYSGNSGGSVPVTLTNHSSPFFFNSKNVTYYFQIDFMMQVQVFSFNPNGTQSLWFTATLNGLNEKIQAQIELILVNVQ